MDTSVHLSGCPSHSAKTGGDLAPSPLTVTFFGFPAGIGQKIQRKRGTHNMNNDNREAGAQSISLILAGIEPIESIEEILKKRGFFDSAESSDRA